MTTFARTFRRPEAHEIDVRCSAALPRRDKSEGRCQLFAGHDGPHAVMFGRHGERAVRSWRSSDPAGAIDNCPGGLERRPWMFGFPLPAWYEAEPIGDAAD
jgi:hypothetical protein